MFQRLEVLRDMSATPAVAIVCLSFLQAARFRKCSWSHKYAWVPGIVQPA